MEEKVAAYLEAKGIKFQYESLILSYAKTVRKGRCEQCGSSKVVKIATYKPDFILDNGIIIEVKGRLTSTDRTKLLAVMRSNPERKLRLYFGSDNKLQKNSEKRYSDWCRQHSIDFSIGTVPTRWLRLNQQEVDDDGLAGRKYDKGKAPILQGLFQYFPLALTAIAKISQYGLEKYNLVYSDVNWAKVENGIARYSDAFGRHILGEHSDPSGMDPESGFHHALQALWNDCARVELMLRQKVITMERYNKKNNDDSSGTQQT